MASLNLESLLEKKRIIVCCGSGGVGKTTVSAVLGVHSALCGKKVLTLTIDPAKRLANSLGLTALGNAETLVPEEKFRQFGENVGIAFQLRDDLFDYENNGMIGKPVGNDIKEKKMTLPLIHVLNNSNGSEKSRILRNIRKNHNKPGKVKEIINYMKENGGLEYAREKMEEYRNKAMDILYEFPESNSRKSLENLVNYTITRKK